LAIWHPEQHPPPDPKRQRDAHFGDKLVEPVTQKGVDDKIEAPNFTRRHLPSSFSSRLVKASTARSTAAVSSANHATSSGPVPCAILRSALLPHSAAVAAGFCAGKPNHHECFADPFSGNVANKGREQFCRIKLGQIAKRNEVLHDLNVAFNFQFTAADKRGQLLAVAVLATRSYA
jgi:hypothetical protein